MKLFLKILILLLFVGCSNVNSVTKKPPFINLIAQQDKYSLILKKYFYKNFTTYDTKLPTITLKTKLLFTSNSTLSNDGNKSLTIIKGTVKFEIFNSLNSKIIRSGQISTSINTGSVSSLYSVDENNNFAKERISQYLASKLYQKTLLSFSHSEN
mgnify:CR=1 FL=1